MVSWVYPAHRAYKEVEEVLAHQEPQEVRVVQVHLEKMVSWVFLVCKVRKVHKEAEEHQEAVDKVAHQEVAAHQVALVHLVKMVSWDYPASKVHLVALGHLD